MEEAATASSGGNAFLATTITRENVYYPGFVPFLQSWAGKQQLKRLSVKNVLLLWASVLKTNCPWTIEEKIKIIERLIEVIPKSLGYPSCDYGKTVLMDVLEWEGAYNLPSNLLKNIISADQANAAITRAAKYDRNFLLGWASCFGVPLVALQHIHKLYPESITHPDGGGDLPLHLAIHRVCNNAQPRCRSDAIDKTLNEWNAALECAYYILNSSPDAAKMKNHEGKLPFHIIFKSDRFRLDSPICFHREFLALAEKVRNIYLDAAQMKCQKYGRLPLHSACSSLSSKNSCLGLLLYALDIYPQAVFEQDLNGDTPFELIPSIDAAKMVVSCISSCDKVKRQLCQLRDEQSGDNILHLMAKARLYVDKEKKKSSFFSKEEALEAIQEQYELKKYLSMAFVNALPCLTMEPNDFGQLPLHRFLSCDRKGANLYDGIEGDNVLFNENMKTFVQCMDKARSVTYQDDPLGKVDRQAGLSPFMMAAASKNPCVSTIYDLILRFVSVTGGISTTSHNEHQHEQQQQKQHQ